MPKNTKSKKRSIYKPKNSHRVSSKRVYKYFSNLLKGGDAGAVPEENAGAVKLPVAGADVDTEENANAAKENDKNGTTFANVIEGATAAATKSADEFFNPKSDSVEQPTSVEDAASVKDAASVEEPASNESLLPDYKEPDNELINKLLDEKDVTIEEQKSHIMDLQLHVTDLKQIINGLVGTKANDKQDLSPMQGAEESSPMQGMEESSPMQGMEESSPMQGMEESSPMQGMEESSPMQGMEESLPMQGESSPMQGEEGSLPEKEDLSPMQGKEGSLLAPASASEPMVKGGRTSNNRRRRRVTKRKSYKY